MNNLLQNCSKPNSACTAAHKVCAMLNVVLLDYLFIKIIAVTLSILFLPKSDIMKLFVAGFPNDFDDVDLKEMFELYGVVTSAKLVVDRATGKTKGFGFIEMPNKTEALETIQSLNGAGIKGKKIVVQEAEERPRTNNFNDRNFNKRY